MKVRALMAVLALAFATGGAPAVTSSLCAEESCECNPSCSGTCPFDGQGTWTSANGNNCSWTCYYSDGHYYLTTCL